jgi:transcriptional regulator with XRE-family HTH domain
VDNKRPDQTNAQSREERVKAHAISKALGDELRRVREARGWSRGQMIARLPSGIGERTLLAYEHGLRQLTVIRLVELTETLGFPGPTLLAQALQRAEIELENLALHVDLRMVIAHRNNKFRPMIPWARNKLNKHPDGIVELTPSAVEELANFIGYTYQELANHFVKCTPEISDPAATGTADSDTRQERG